MSDMLLVAPRGMSDLLDHPFLLLGCVAGSVYIGTNGRGIWVGDIA